MKIYIGIAKTTVSSSNHDDSDDHSNTLYVPILFRDCQSPQSASSVLLEHSRAL